MSRFIDRRPNGRHKSALNRHRFLIRFKKQIQDALRKAIAGRSIKNIDQSGERITIPAKDISEPHYQYGAGGKRNIVLPGNTNFIPGDKIKRPSVPDAEDQGNQASNEGEGLDEFSFEISKQEFLELFFQDLELPNLIKTQIQKIPDYKTIRSGYTSSGVPANLNIVRSLKNSIGRKLSLSGPYKLKIKKLEQDLEELRKTHPEDDPIVLELKQQIEKTRKKLKTIPYIDPVDLKYNNRIQVPMPSSQAVMFCLMDVSGSMDESKKEIAKKFFILLYLFLSRSYENVQVIFIRHHTSAKEVNEEDFFYSKETGGTIVSSALELMSTIMHTRFSPNDWNIYAAQASDGDNWNNDSPHCQHILENEIMPFIQYFAYVEIKPRQHQSLWEAYLKIKEKFSFFAMQNIEDPKDIYPVFRELFKRQLAKDSL